MKKLNWATRQTLTPIGLERGFREKYQSSGFTAGRKDVKIASESALEDHTALKLYMRQNMTSKDCHMRRRIPCSSSPMTRIS